MSQEGKIYNISGNKLFIEIINKKYTYEVKAPQDIKHYPKKTKIFCEIDHKSKEISKISLGPEVVEQIQGAQMGAIEEKEKTADILPMYQVPIKKKEEILHIYMPYSPKHLPDQIDSLKTNLEKYQYTWVAYLKLSEENGSLFLLKFVDKITEQLKNKTETRLYMTDFKSLHVFELEEIHFSEPKGWRDDPAVLDFYKENVVEVYFKVKDVYVLAVNHDYHNDYVHEELKGLSFVNQTKFDNEGVITSRCDVSPFSTSVRYPAPVLAKCGERIFFGFPKENITEYSNNLDTFSKKWFHINRYLNEEYNLCARHLEINTFYPIWSNLKKGTQHYLIDCEMQRVISADHNSSQAFRLLELAWNSYFKAVCCELYGVLYLDMIDIHNVTDLKLDEGAVEISKFITFIWDFDDAQVRDNSLKNKFKKNIELIKLLKTKEAHETLWLLNRLRNLLEHQWKLSDMIEDQKVLNERVQNMRLLLNYSFSISKMNIFYLIASKMNNHFDEKVMTEKSTFYENFKSDQKDKSRIENNDKDRKKKSS